LIAPLLAAYRLTGSTYLTSAELLLLAKFYPDLGQLEDAWRTIEEAKSVI